MVLWGFVTLSSQYGKVLLITLALLSDEISGADKVKVKYYFILTDLRYLKTVNDSASSTFSMQWHVVTSNKILTPGKKTQGPHS